MSHTMFEVYIDVIAAELQVIYLILSFGVFYYKFSVNIYLMIKNIKWFRRKVLWKRQII